MTSRQIRFLVVPALLLVALFGFAPVEQGTAAPEVQHPVSPRQVPELLELVRLDHRVRFEARVTGDFSAFPSIYYNDPAVQMHEDYGLAVRSHGDEAKEALRAIGGEANGGDTGYLTASIASHLSSQANMQAWETAQERAAAEGRHATLADLQDEFTPIERPRLEDWTDPRLELFDVMVGETTASAKIAYASPRVGGQILSYQFVKAGGQWFISYMESSWSQGDPDYLAPGQPLKIRSGWSSHVTTLACDPGMPAVSEEEARRLVEQHLGGRRFATEDVVAIYGLATLGHEDPASGAWIGVQNVMLPSGETLRRIEQRPIWIVDVGGVESYGAGCPECKPALFDHVVYAVDVETRSVLLAWMYKE